MRLEHFAGIDGPLNIDFAEQGITVIEGPNETGKSSIVGALRLVRDFKASSQAAEVRAVRPTHVQADPSVEIELRTGPYHLTYAKTFARKGATQLTVHAPAAESLTGDAAHDRATAILAETTDLALWSALQATQGEPLAQPVLATLAPLHTALASLGGEEAVGGHDELMQRVEAEYLTYYTPTGRPTGEHARLAGELTEAEARASQAEEALSEIARLTESHERLVLRREELTGAIATQRKEVDRLAERCAELDQLRQELQEARRIAEGADQTLAIRQKAAERRTQLIAELDEAQRARREAESDATMAATALEEHEAQTGSEDPDTAIDAARSELDLAADEQERARAQQELEQALRRLDEARAAQAARDEARAVLRENAVDEESVQRLQDDHLRWQTAAARSAGAAPTVTLERLGDLPVLLDGQEDEVREYPVVRPVVVEVPGAARVTISPPAPLAEEVAEADRLRREYQRACEALGVADLEEARTRARMRTEQERLLADSTAELRRALGQDDSLAQLEERVEYCRERVGADEPPDPETAAERHRKAIEAYQRALTVAEDSRVERRRAFEIGQQLRERLVRAGTAAEHVRARAERAAAVLAADRAQADDATVAAAAEEAREAATRAFAAVARVEAVLNDHGADELASEIDARTDALETAEHRLRELDHEIIAVEATLEVRGGEGLQDAANRAAEAVADLRRRWVSVDTRARAARRLHLTLTDHAQRARRRYVGPFRTAIAELGRTVFGPGFDVEIGEDLSILTRTLDGRTVPFESLSGGAKEQLGVLGRVATARLVDDDHGAPVILDDILGYADPLRRQRVLAMLRQVAREGRVQIIVLTCEPSRFDLLVPDATRRLG
ncbi:hypothetical protein BHE97_09290 [Aeromicrobium sp. PE09-221]|nr:hypothetical protein BHE97_09290 [Aeromicrobium sp. PE09-221]